MTITRASGCSQYGRGTCSLVGRCYTLALDPTHPVDRDNTYDADPTYGARFDTKEPVWVMLVC